MTAVTHLFFDLHGTLVNGQQLHPCYSVQLGRALAARYGRTPGEWTHANRRVLADWDSYYADLDLTGEHGIDDMYEGLVRTTRGMFRLVGAPEPPPAELSALSRELPALATRTCDALFPDSRGVVRRLHAAGYTLGVTTHALVGQARGLLLGGGVLPYFLGPVVGPDLVERFQKDATFYLVAARLAGAAPASCLAIDDDAGSIAGAHAAGMQTVHLCRRNIPPAPAADRVLRGSLKGLLSLLNATDDAPPA